MRCSAAREAGTCANTGSFYIDQIEATVLRGIMYELRHPEALKAYLGEYQKEMAHQRRDVGRRRVELQKGHSAICESLDRLVAAVAAGSMPLELVKAKSDELTAERDRLKAELDIADRDALANIALHPEAVAHFQRTMGELAGEFEADPGMQHTEVINESVRALIASVTVMPGSTALVSVLGKLGALIGSPPPTVAIRMVPQEGLGILLQPIETYIFFKNQKTRYTFGYTRAPSSALCSMESSSLTS